MGAPLQSFYPPSLYGVPTSLYPYQQPAGTFPGAYGGGGGAGGGAGAAGGAGSTAGGNFYGEKGRACSFFTFPPTIYSHGTPLAWLAHGKAFVRCSPLALAHCFPLGRQQPDRVFVV